MRSFTRLKRFLIEDLFCFEKVLSIQIIFIYLFFIVGRLLLLEAWHKQQSAFPHKQPMAHPAQAAAVFWASPEHAPKRSTAKTHISSERG